MRRIVILLIVVIILTMLPVTALAADAFKPSGATASQTMLATILTGVMAVLFIVVAVMLSMRAQGTEDSGSRLWPAFLMAIVLAVVLRVFVALAYEGYSTDIACFKGWAVAAYDYGPAGFYTSGIYADYPPGYMYVLYVVGFFRNLFSISAGSSLFTLMVKLPSIMAEVVLAIVVYRAASRQLGRTFGLLCGAFLLFNPALFFNSGVWGQIDAFFILFIVLCLYYLRKENFLLGAVFFALALLIKPQAIMLAPVVGLCYIYAFFKKGGFVKALLYALGSAAIVAAVFVAGVLPFTGDQPYTWILEKYTGVVSLYPYASLNAFNLYALAGANWAPAGDSFWLLAYQTWGIIFIVLICVAVVFLQWRSRAQRATFDIAAFLVISIYMLAHAMHERYLLPACVFLLLAYVYTRDLSTLLFTVAFSLTALFGQLFTLYAQTVVVDTLPTLVISAVNMALYLIYMVQTIRRLSSSKVLIKSPALNG